MTQLKGGHKLAIQCKLLLLSFVVIGTLKAFHVNPNRPLHIQKGDYRIFSSSSCCRALEGDWESDFEDFADTGSSAGDNNFLKLSDVFQARGAEDLSACRSRQFSLGRDFVLSDFVGNMGFDEITDWEYYYQNEEDESDRKVVQPNPFDASTPRRTRETSGSVVSSLTGLHTCDGWPSSLVGRWEKNLFAHSQITWG